MTSAIRSFRAAAALAVAIAAVACGAGRQDGGLKEIQRVKAADLDIVFLSDDGALNRGNEVFVIEFRRADGTLHDAGTVTTGATMSMPGMTMPASMQVAPADVPGRYRATGEFGMAGGWQMRMEWNGPAGHGSASFEGTVQ